MNNQPLLLCGAALCLLSQPSFGDAPRVLFISENTPAAGAVTQLIVSEYNLPARIDWLLAGNPARDFVSVAFSEIPDADQLLVNRLAQLGLTAEDPADRGFTDFLSALGYDVRRSVTTRVVDPFFGTETVTHEFHGTVPGPLDPNRMVLSQAQIDTLNSYDLIIMSRDTGNGIHYSWAGGTFMQLHAQWTALRIPVISMNAGLIATNEWGSFGWGWFYGFTSGHTAGVPFDRQNTTPRFVFPDLTPVVNNTDPLLDGITLSNNRADIFLDSAENPNLPATIRKFSNNANFNYPNNVDVILSFEYPSFFHVSAGEIDTKNPILARFQSGVRFFDPGPPMPNERILTPAGPRVYFAAGMGNNGVFNLNANGQRLLQNIMHEFLPLQQTEPEFLWTGAVEVENGWWFSEWYGWFYANAYPWIFHSDHGWQYTAATLDGGNIVYDFIWDSWLWVAESAYPWLYNYDLGSWYFFMGKTSGRSFFSANDQQTVLVPVP